MKVLRGKDKSPRTRNKEGKVELLRVIDSLNRDDVTYSELCEELGQSKHSSINMVRELGIPVSYVKVPTVGNRTTVIGHINIATWRLSQNSD